MKKGIACILIIIALISFCSCQMEDNMGFWSSDHDRAQNQIENLLQAIQDKDTDLLKSLFATKTLNELQTFDESAGKLFDYFTGSVKSYDDGAGPFVETEKEDGFVFQLMESSFDVKTDLCEYRFAMQFITRGNADEIGIVSIYVIKAIDDVNLDYAYWGDGKFLPGIHIAIPNI